MLATLIMDPFAQQIVTFCSCEIPQPSVNATVSRSNYFSSIGEHIGAAMSSVPSNILNSVNAGTFGQLEALVTPTQCDSGNCTFPPFNTLAYCSVCADISDNVSVLKFIPLKSKLTCESSEDEAILVLRPPLTVGS